MERVTLNIDGFTHAGEGVGRHHGFAVFVPGAIPGETVLADLEPARKNYARARLVEVTAPSPARREPPCRHFPACGGCSLQHLDYAEQLRLKTRLVRDSLNRLAGLDHVPVLPTLGLAGSPWHYRNKVHFRAARRRGKTVLGYYGEKSHTLTAVFPGGPDPGCLLLHPALNTAATVLPDLLDRFAPVRDGFLRHVILRHAPATAETMAVLVTAPGAWPQENDFAAALVRRLPPIRSVVRSLHEGRTGTVLGSRERVLAGRPYLTDRLGDLELRLAPASFYQVNPAQTPVVYRQAAAYADLQEADTVVDAYSGVGSLALWLAGRCRRVYGLEIEPAAVADAQANALANHTANVEFHRGDVARSLPALAASGVEPDVVVLDPPRRGCSRTVLKEVAALGVPRVVYLSCDPGTLARDLAFLATRGYRVNEVQPVDMFPWTPHIECVARLRKKVP